MGYAVGRDKSQTVQPHFLLGYYNFINTNQSIKNRMKKFTLFIMMLVMCATTTFAQTAITSAEDVKPGKLYWFRSLFMYSQGYEGYGYSSTLVYPDSEGYNDMIWASEPVYLTGFNILGRCDCCLCECCCSAHYKHHDEKSNFFHTLFFKVTIYGLIISKK